jgi:MFS family permease
LPWLVSTPFVLVFLALAAGLTWFPGNRTVAFIYFVALGSANLYLISIFWSAMADVWRPDLAKRFYGYVAAGGSAGAILGPRLVSGLVHELGPAPLIVVACAFIMGSALFASFARRALCRAPDGSAVPDAALPVAKETMVVTAERDGVLAEQLALPFGIAAWRLGAGRARAQDPVQHAAGIDLHAKPGDPVSAGQPLFTLSADEPERFERALEALEGAYRIGDVGEAVLDGGPLIAERIGA